MTIIEALRGQMTTCIYCGARYLSEPVFGGGCPGCGIKEKLENSFKKFQEHALLQMICSPGALPGALSTIEPFGFGGLAVKPKCPCCGR